ncbi:Guanine nucleotide exchange factor [Entamoeba marina]
MSHKIKRHSSTFQGRDSPRENSDSHTSESKLCVSKIIPSDVDSYDSHDFSSTPDSSYGRLSRTSASPRIDKEAAYDFVLFGTCDYFVELPYARQIIAVKDKIYYLADDHVYFTSSTSKSLNQTGGISRSSHSVCNGPKGKYFLFKDKLARGKEKNYHILDDYLSITDISGYSKKLIALDKFGGCIEITKDSKQRINTKKPVVRVVCSKNITAMLFKDGTVESSHKCSFTNNLMDITGGVSLWGITEDGYVENHNGELVLDKKMLRIMTGYDGVVGEGEDLKLCHLIKKDSSYFWEYICDCNGKDVTCGDGYCIIGRQRKVSSFIPLLLCVRRVIEQINVFKEYYVNASKKSAENYINNPKSHSKRNLKKGEVDPMEVKIAQYKYLDNVAQLCTKMLNYLRPVNAHMTRLYSYPYQDDTFGFNIYSFLKTTSRMFIQYARDFNILHEKGYNWYNETSPFKEFEDLIPEEISKRLFDKRSDILTVAFSPLKFLSELSVQLQTIKANISKLPVELEWLKLSSNLSDELLERCDEDIKFNNIHTWNYWYANEKGRMVVSTGTISELTTLLRTDLRFEPDYRTIFVNTITLYSPIDTVLQKLIPRKQNIDSLSNDKIKNILLTLHLWIEQNPYQFSLLDGSLSRIESLLTVSKKDQLVDLKNEVRRVFSSARSVEYSPFAVPKTVLYTFSARDLCTGLNDHIYFSIMMTYIHTTLFNKITESEIVMYFTKKADVTPNIKFMTTSFNWLSENLSRMIKECPMSFQSQFFNFLMKTAEQFYDQRNFFGLCAVVFAFHRIQDFDYLKSNMSKETQQSIVKFEALCSFNNNYQALHEEISKAQKPLIPFIGILTKDLLVTDEMYASFISKTGHFNFNKLREIHQISLLYRSYQSPTPEEPRTIPPEIFSKVKEIHGL